MLIFAEGIDKNKLTQELRDKLLDLEDLYKGDLIITSGFRGEEYNAKVGGVKRSSHLKGLAVDIFCRNGSIYWKIRESALKAGFKRLGHGKWHIHLDIDPDKPQYCEWWE